MVQQTLYKECPLCTQAPVELKGDGVYQCKACGLTLKERSILGLFKKGHFSITDFGQQEFALAQEGLKDVVLTPDTLKIVIGNIYSDEQLADIASGNIEVISPVRTILAQIILEQLNEECFINVADLRRGHGKPLTEESWYRPTQKASQKGIEWQDEGNLFCTTHRLVLPSDRFTFIRLDRKVTAVQAYIDGIAIQRKGEEFATYFIGCYPHEAALVAAYVMAKIPKLRPSELVESESQ